MKYKSLDKEYEVNLTSYSKIKNIALD